MNHVGERYGILTVEQLSEVPYISPSGRKHYIWICRCDCGNVIRVMSDNLKRTKSCGCLKKEVASLVGRANTKHGCASQGNRTRLYRIWSGMKARCYNINNHEYDRYGAPGIYVCSEWKESFQAFMDWALSHGYRDDLSIDRINGKDGYSPENCRWATPKQQQNNLSSNVRAVINGKSMTAAEIRDTYGINHARALTLIRNGSIEQAIMSERSNMHDK